jgi:hypothetical protein
MSKDHLMRTSAARASFSRNLELASAYGLSAGFSLNGPLSVVEKPIGFQPIVVVRPAWAIVKR